VSDRWLRIRAIIAADGKERLRRPSTAVTFLAICFIAYLWVPDPSSGRAVMVIDGSRVVYNSPALALATAVLGSFMLGLFGYYGVSRSIARDLGRTGSVVAATPVANWEYLVGKALGNLAFLTVLAVGYMVSSMALQTVRSSAPLEPLVYFAHYLYLLPPALLFTSVVAVLFESVPGLAGKLGDVLFFFLWMTLVGLTAALAGLTPVGGSLSFSGLDVSGLGTVIHDLRSIVGTDSLSIGASSFDPSLEPYLFAGLSFSTAGVAQRVLALAVPVPLFCLAWWRFHRFDPARVRALARGASKGYLRSLQRLLRPVTSLLTGRLLAGIGRRPGLVGAVIADAALTLVRNPLGVVALAAAFVVSWILPLPALGSGGLPAIFAAMALLVAGAAGRERNHGTRGLVYASPHLRPLFVGWKMAAALILCVLFVVPAGARLALKDPCRAAVLLGGAFFVAAAATALDILTASTKVFIVLFLSFWYLVLNDRGSHPQLDFAGFYGTATARTGATYLAIALVLLLAAEIAHLRRAAA
jgi:hypothetical protein